MADGVGPLLLPSKCASSQRERTRHHGSGSVEDEGACLLQGVDAALRRYARLQGELHEAVVVEAVTRLEGGDVDEADALAPRDFLHQGIGHIEGSDPWPVPS